MVNSSCPELITVRRHNNRDGAIISFLRFVLSRFFSLVYPTITPGYKLRRIDLKARIEKLEWAIDYHNAAILVHSAACPDCVKREFMRGQAGFKPSRYLRPLICTDNSPPAPAFPSERALFPHAR